MKRLKDIRYGIRIKEIKGNTNIAVETVAFDSRKVNELTLFVAVKGVNVDGHDYLSTAEQNGACAIICESLPNNFSPNITYVTVPDSSFALGLVASNYYDNPSDKLKLIGITGTNGKTTSATLLYDLFRLLGHKTGLISTVNIKILHKTLPTSHTTPDAITINKVLAQMVDQGCTHVFMEVSSHALDQNRLENIKYFKSSSILNIGSDHLDYHKNIENYAQSKLKIFSTESESKFINQKILNENPNIFIEDSSLTKVSNNPSTDLYYEILECSFKKSLFKIIQKNEQGDSIYQFETSIFPKFNIANLIFAICSAGLSNFDKNKINKMDFLKLPKGRSDFIKDIPANIIIDYAHNPEGFILFLSSLQDFFDNLVVVFGCGGNRDRSKRPLMLNAALKYADKVIFTSDNSRNEEFSEILSDATASNNSKSKIDVIEDRKAAIIHGTNLIKKDDCLVILGKGHEETQEKDGQILFFSDHEVVSEIYN